ncbi:MAG: hypothetical protein ACRCXB_14075 [Aeromonadaceae bacterium]
MSKLIDLMRQAGVQWPEGAEYAAQDGSYLDVYFYSATPRRDMGKEVWLAHSQLAGVEPVELEELADDWETPIASAQWFSVPSYTAPDYMREQQRLAARSQERRVLVRELMLRHPELTGPQAVEQADEILSTLEGLK